MLGLGFVREDSNNSDELGQRLSGRKSESRHGSYLTGFALNVFMKINVL